MAILADGRLDNREIDWINHHDTAAMVGVDQDVLVQVLLDCCRDVITEGRAWSVVFLLERRAGRLADDITDPGALQKVALSAMLIIAKSADGTVQRGQTLLRFLMRRWDIAQPRRACCRRLTSAAFRHHRRPTKSDKEKHRERPDQVSARRIPPAQGLVQHRRRPAGAAAAAAASGHAAAPRAVGSGAALPQRDHRPGDVHRALRRHPEPVRDVLCQWRPSPCSAPALEKLLGTPAKIYYKYEGVSPAGSHNPTPRCPRPGTTPRRASSA